MLNKKIFYCFFILLAFLFIKFTPVFADTISDSVASSVNQDIVENSDNKCKVTVSQGSSFVVSIPKEVSLVGKKGEENNGIYTICVKGNIDSTEIIKVIPDEFFYLKDNTGKKKDIKAVIKQNVQSFQIGDVESVDKVTITEENIMTGVSTIGKISTEDLTAGSWTGFFNIKILLV